MWFFFWSNNAIESKGNEVKQPVYKVVCLNIVFGKVNRCVEARHLSRLVILYDHFMSM